MLRRPILQVSAHDILQHGTLSARLTADDDYLRKVDWVIDADGCEDILELVYESEGDCQCPYFCLWLSSIPSLRATQSGAL